MLAVSTTLLEILDVRGANGRQLRRIWPETAIEHRVRIEYILGVLRRWRVDILLNTLPPALAEKHEYYDYHGNELCLMRRALGLCLIDGLLRPTYPNSKGISALMTFGWTGPPLEFRRLEAVDG